MGAANTSSASTATCVLMAPISGCRPRASSSLRTASHVGLRPQKINAQLRADGHDRLFQLRSAGQPAFFQFSMPPRRTKTCSSPASESSAAALAERCSVRQIVINGDLICFSSLNLPGSSPIGMLRAPAMCPKGPRNSSALRTSIRANRRRTPSAAGVLRRRRNVGP